MGGKNLTGEQRERAMALFSLGTSINGVARDLGISTSTSKKIKDGLAVNPDYNILREMRKQQFIDEAWDHITSAMRLGFRKIELAGEAQAEIDRIIDERQKGIISPKEANELIKSLSIYTNIPLAHISTYFGTLYDKQALAGGDPTAREDKTFSIVPAPKPEEVVWEVYDNEQSDQLPEPPGHNE